jgi:hypothetical protein
MYYEMLPIFKSTMNLVVYIETIVKEFDKYHKYTIGEDLRTYSKKMLFLIQRANMSQDKQQELLELRNGCEELKMLVMLCKELKAFNSFKQFEHSSKLTVAVCRQAQAWLKNSQSARVSK